MKLVFQDRFFFLGPPLFFRSNQSSNPAYKGLSERTCLCIFSLHLHLSATPQLQHFIMSNTSEHSGVGEPQTEPTVETTESWTPPVMPKEAARRLKELFSKPYIMNTSMDDPPSPALTEAGEKAMLELGLSNALIPSIHLNPSWNRTSRWKVPGTREFFGEQAAEMRKQAQTCARKAEEWRQDRDDGSPNPRRTKSRTKRNAKSKEKSKEAVPTSQAQG